MPKTTQLSVTDCRLTFFSAIFSLSHSENLTRPSLSQVAPMLQMRAKENQGSISSLRRASCSSVIGFSPWKKMSGTLRHQQSLVVITFHEWEITNNFEWMSVCIDKVSSILQLTLETEESDTEPVFSVISRYILLWKHEYWEEQLTMTDGFLRSMLSFLSFSHQFTG